MRGRYLEIDPPRRVVVSWGVAGNTELPPGATQVEFTLTPTPAGTHLRLVHRGLPPSQAPMHATGWNHFLPRLSLAAAGTDPGPRPLEPGLLAGTARARGLIPVTGNFADLARGDVRVLDPLPPSGRGK